MKRSDVFIIDLRIYLANIIIPWSILQKLIIILSCPWKHSHTRHLYSYHKCANVLTFRCIWFFFFVDDNDVNEGKSIEAVCAYFEEVISFLFSHHNHGNDVYWKSFSHVFLMNWTSFADDIKKKTIFSFFVFSSFFDSSFSPMRV